VDDARLCLTVARTAAVHGAVVVNRCRVVELTKDADGRASGAVVDAGGRLISVHAKVVVNAAGVWSDAVRTLDGTVAYIAQHLTVYQNDAATFLPPWM